MSNKLPHQLTVEQLLEIVKTKQGKQEPEVVFPKIHSDVVAFLSFYKIEPGEDVVPTRLILYLYNIWSKIPVSKSEFEFEMSKYILNHQKGGKLYYSINRSGLNLTKEAYKILDEKTRDKTKSPPWRQHFEAYLNRYGIKPGTQFIEGFVLYHLYNEYLYEINKKQPIGYNQFIDFCRLYFKDERITENKTMWFGVDDSIKSILTEEQLAALRKNRHRFNGTKKTNKKKQRKISSP